MRRVIPEGQAQAGDLLRSPWGEVFEVVSVHGAHEVINAISERSPIVRRGSMSERCALFGSQTTGRERRDLERARLKRANARARHELVTTKEGH